MTAYDKYRYYLGVLNGSLWSSAVVLGRQWPRLALKTIQFRRRIAGIEALRVGRGAQQLCAGGRGGPAFKIEAFKLPCAGPEGLPFKFSPNYTLVQWYI